MEMEIEMHDIDLETETREQCFADVIGKVPQKRQ